MKSRRSKVFIGMFYTLWRHVERGKRQHARKKQTRNKVLRSDHKLATRCCVLVVFRAGVARLLRQRYVLPADILVTFYVFRKFFDLKFDAI